MVVTLLSDHIRKMQCDQQQLLEFAKSHRINLKKHETDTPLRHYTGYSISLPITSYHTPLPHLCQTVDIGFGLTDPRPRLRACERAMGSFSSRREKSGVSDSMFSSFVGRVEDNNFGDA